MSLKSLRTTGNRGLPKAFQVNIEKSVLESASVRGMKKVQLLLGEIHAQYRNRTDASDLIGSQTGVSVFPQQPVNMPVVPQVLRPIEHFAPGQQRGMLPSQPITVPTAQEPEIWIARENYAAASAKELTIFSMEAVEVLSRNPSGWWQCRRSGGAIGWLPSTLLAPADKTWSSSPHAPRVPLSQQATSQSGGGNIEERIKAGVESMLRKHQSDLVELIKAQRERVSPAPMADQLELRMRILEEQTSGRQADLEQRLLAQLGKDKIAAKAERDHVLTELRRLESEGDTTSATVHGLRNQLQHVEVVQAELVVLSRAAKQREEIRQQYGSEPRVWDFYNSLCVHFEEWLLGIKSAASGIVSHDVQSAAGRVGGFMCLFGELCEMIPFVGEGAAAFKVIGGMISAVDHKRQQSVIERISKFGTLAELQNLSANLAYALTRRYEYQLLQLPSIPDVAAARREKPKWSIRKFLQRGKEKVEQVVLDKDPKSASEALADFVLSLFVHFLTASSRNVLEPAMLERALFECATRPVKYELDDSKVNAGLEDLIKRAGKYDVDSRTGLKFTFAGILIGPGLRAPSGVYFDGGITMQPQIYQYCSGDDAEVLSRQLVPCSIPDLSRCVASPVPIPSSSLPTAMPMRPVPVAQKRTTAQQQQQQQLALMQLKVLQPPIGTGVSASPSIVSAGPIDDVKKMADEMFDIYDVSRTGFLSSDEFVRAFEELSDLNATHFGSLVPERTLRDVCDTLSKGSSGVPRDSFVEFFRKARAFTLRKACTLQLKRGSLAPIAAVPVSHATSDVINRK